ncbi:hypothetical protein [Roseateles puraquae]|uniref:hypothetical protein n=1 Tax=Roseateles puraquae TaxID=431059 RepID=UPI0011850F43|nr:hypothetical protein [Roseateles puraquae]MDG0857463.1 hypothetical protein [Roseateles puraquae]
MIPIGNGAFGLTFANERDAPGVEQEERVDVMSWRMCRLPSGDVHLSIWREGGVARVTSALASADPAMCLVRTSSGRQYRLLAGPEVHPTNREVIEVNAARSGLSGAADISDLFWSKLSAVKLQP